MKMKGNCRIYGGTVARIGDCEHLRWPIYHAGFTGKEGPETWWMCAHHRKPIRHIQSCELAGTMQLIESSKL